MMFAQAEYVDADFISELDLLEKIPHPPHRIGRRFDKRVNAEFHESLSRLQPTRTNPMIG